MKLPLFKSRLIILGKIKSFHVMFDEYSPHIEGVVNMSSYQLHRNKVISLAPIVEDKSILIRGFQLKVDVNHVVSF